MERIFKKKIFVKCLQKLNACHSDLSTNPLHCPGGCENGRRKLFILWSSSVKEDGLSYLPTMIFYYYLVFTVHFFHMHFVFIIFL